MPRPRDNQRQRLYDAEKVLHGVRCSKHAARHLIDTQSVAGWTMTRPGWVCPPEEEWPTYTHSDGRVQRLKPIGPQVPLRVPSVAAVRAYVDEVTATAWYQRRWRTRPRVEAGRGSNADRYGVGMRVGQMHRRSEAVILHEMAHVLIGPAYADHGPEFAGVLLFLVERVMGKRHADALRSSFKEHRVKYNYKCLPEPSQQRLSAARQRSA